MSSFRQDRQTRKPYARPAATRAPEGQWLHDKAPGAPRSRPANVPASQANTPTTSGGPTDKLVVSNLHYEIMPQDLTAIFGQIGTLVRDPIIRYDRSGRSEGRATVFFETVAEAVRAKKQFNGILAKGQPMSIEFEAAPVRKQRSSSVPTGSLLSRIQKPPLLDRLARDDSNIKSTSSTKDSRDIGPIRSRPLRASRKKGLKKPATAEDLDKELDAFMGDSNTNTDAAAAPVATTASTVLATVEDVDMA